MWTSENSPSTHFVLVPESPSEPLSAAHNTPDAPSNEASGSPQTDALHIPESENEKHEFVGNPVRDPRYWVRRSGKRVAEFHLATHPEPDKEKTLYYRIRAFDKQAERVRDTVRKGQTEVSVVAYGPKYWPITRRTKDGQEKREVVQGYYAGFVNVPKRYRGEQPPATQQPLE
jgi:single-stranded DNA-binding protein